MRLAVLGDIHANAPALSAVLDSARSHGADALLLTGDYVGYYYWPCEVLEMLASWERWCVRGNHDRMLETAAVDSVYLARCTGMYGSGLEVALAQLSAQQKNELVLFPDSQRVVLDGCSFLIAHGSPWDPDEYLYPDAPDRKWARVASEGADIVLLGHTHYRFVRQQGEVMIVNPGSVGQPRDRQPGASWALIDTQDRSARLFTESYDVQGVVSQAKQRDPQLPYLHEVLVRT